MAYAEVAVRGDFQRRGGARENLLRGDFSLFETSPGIRPPLSTDAVKPPKVTYVLGSRPQKLQGGVDKELRRRWQIHPHEDRHCNPLPRGPHGSPGP